MKIFSGRNVLSAIAAGVLLSAVGAGTVFSYIRTATSQVAESMREAVPVEFELKRLEQLTAEMIPEIQANQKVAAQLDVDIEFLEREIEQLDSDATEQRQQMLVLRQALNEECDDPRTFNGREYTTVEIEQDLERRLRAWQDLNVRIEAKRRLLQTRRRTLDSAVARIHACRQQHALLTEKSESLHAELKLLELAQSRGEIRFDETRLTQARELSGELERRIRVLQRLVEGETLLADGIPVETDSRTIAARIDDVLNASVQVAER